MNIKALCSAALLSFGLVVAVSAQAAAWERIGTQTVRFGVDRDIIRVRGVDWHKQIKICVSRRPVWFRDVDVVFGNAGSQDIKIRKLIGANQCTRNIDLRGLRRNISLIRFVYNKLLPGKAPVVTVYAR
ncbi:hypothetical protein [Taklimakanibacter lacteus]|uniref:hypothetical protein n=1 Tax=Taklimakanibacter lacteus TaxID=2268456 RepID=UPI000E668937